MKKILYLMALIPSFAFSGLRSDSALFTTAASTITLETNGVDASTAKVNLYSGTSFFGSYISGPHVRLCDKVGLNCVDLTQSGLSFPTSTLGASFSNIGEINFLDGSQQITAWTGEAPNVAGQILIKHADGTQTSTTTTTDTDNARGQLLMDMWANRLDRDTFILSGSTFNIANSSMDMTLNGVGHVNIQGMGRDSTLLKATDPSVLLNPGTGSVIEDLTVECTSVNDFCLPIGTENRGSTNVTVKNSRIKAPRDLVYTDNQTPVNWNFYDCLFEGGWDGFVQQALSFTSTTTVFNVYSSQVDMVANHSNDDAGGHAHGVLAYNPMGSMRFFNTNFTSSNGSIENGDIDISLGHVQVFGGSMTAKGVSPFHVRDDQTGGDFRYTSDTVFSSTMCSFSNQISPNSFASMPQPYRIGIGQGIQTVSNDIFNWGDIDSLSDGNLMTWNANTGVFTINESGLVTTIAGDDITTDFIHTSQLTLPISYSPHAQAFGIRDNNDAFNSPQFELEYSNTIFDEERINSDGSFYFNPVGGSWGTSTATKLVYAVQVATSGTNFATTQPGFHAAYGGILFAHNVSTGNTGTTETDFYKDTITSCTIRVSSWTISFDYSGQALNSATATTDLKMYLSTTPIYDSGNLAMTTNSSWHLHGYCMWNTKSTARCETDLSATGITVTSPVNVLNVGGLNWNANTVLKITGTRAGVGAATGDITAMTGIVKFEPAP